MSNHFICVAVDGTNSRGVDYAGGASAELQLCFENKSHVRSFCDKLGIPAENKLFLHGPGIQTERKDGMSLPETYDAATGASCERIAKEAMSWLQQKITAHPTVNIILVGHSRGGHIVTELAIRLSSLRISQLATNTTQLKLQSTFAGAFPATSLTTLTPGFPQIVPNTTSKTVNQPVYFLGLYDAVDMTGALGDTSIIPNNVEWIYHAMRSKKIGSRASWGNTATSAKTPNKDKHFFEFFDGTHGSMGGAFATECSDSGLIPSCDIPLTATQNRHAGELAHQFISTGAKKAGLPGF